MQLVGNALYRFIASLQDFLERLFFKGLAIFQFHMDSLFINLEATDSLTQGA